MTKADVVVIGAGVAGSSAAYGLAKRGVRVVLIESHGEVPETIKGELLQPGGVQSLEQLGLRDCLEGIDAASVCGFAVCGPADDRVLAYPELAGTGRQAEGRSFRHHLFVENLRRAAKSCPNITWIDGTVMELWQERERVRGVRFRRAGGGIETCEAPLTVVASGRNAKLRKQLGEDQAPQKVSRSVGVLLENAGLPHPGHGHVFLVKPSPALGYRVGSDAIRLLLDLPDSLGLKGREEVKAFVNATIAPQLPEALREPLRLAMEEGRMQSMQNMVLAPQGRRPLGVVSLGDALNMRHPLTGSGMTVALHDARCLVSLASPEVLREPRALRQMIHAFHRKREPLAMTVDILSGALYRIFRAEQPGVALLRDAVMRYWQMGGVAVAGPMSLLAGLTPDPMQLFLHYSALALLGMGRPFLEPAPQTSRRATVEQMRTSFQLGWAALRTMAPFVGRSFKALPL